MAVREGGDFQYLMNMLLLGKDTVGKTWLLHARAHPEDLPRGAAAAPAAVEDKTGGVGTDKKDATATTTAPSDVYTPTIGVEFATATHTVAGQVIRAHVWDTGGHERFHLILRGYLRGARVIVAVFDLTDPESLDWLLTWHASSRTTLEEQAPLILLCGSKCDDVTGRRVGMPAIREAMEALSAFGFVEASGATGENVRALFQLAVVEFHSKNYAPLGAMLLSRVPLILLCDATRAAAPPRSPPPGAPTPAPALSWESELGAASAPAEVVATLQKLADDVAAGRVAVEKADVVEACRRKREDAAVWDVGAARALQAVLVALQE